MRGKILNPQGKVSRVLDCYMLPATLQGPSLLERGGLVNVLEKGKQILTSITSNLFKYFFATAEGNNLMKHRTLFEVLELNPISTPPQITIEQPRNDEIGETEDKTKKEFESLKKGIVVKRLPSHDIYNDFYYGNKKNKAMLYDETQTDLSDIAATRNFKGNFNGISESIVEKCKTSTGKGIKKRNTDSCGEMETKGTDEEDELDFQVRNRRTEKMYKHRGGESEGGKKVIRKIIRQRKLSISHCTDLSVMHRNPSNLESDEMIENRNFEEYKNYMQGIDKPCHATTVNCYICESSISPDTISISSLPQPDPHISPARSRILVKPPTKTVHPPALPSPLFSNPPCNISTTSLPNTFPNNSFLNTNKVKNLETPYIFGEQKPPLDSSQITDTTPKTNGPPSDTPIDMEMEFASTDFKTCVQTYPSSSVLSGHTGMFKNSSESRSNSSNSTTVAFSTNNSCFGSTGMCSSSIPNTADRTVSPNKNFSIGIVASSGKRQKR